MSYPPPPVRGEFNPSSTPFLVIASSKTLGTKYILTNTTYTLQEPNIVSEAVFIPGFAGDLQFPQTQQDRGKYFAASWKTATSEFVTPVFISDFPDNAPAEILDISPLSLIIVNGSFQTVTFDPAVEPSLLSGDGPFPGKGTSGAGYVYRVLINAANSTPLPFTITAAESFYTENGMLYAGYPYQITVPNSSVFPFRNLQAATTTTNRVTDYNRHFGGVDDFYQVNSTTGNNLYLNEVRTYTSGSTTTNVMFFPSTGSGSDLQFSNFSLTDYEFFFIPINYYPSNFNVNSKTSGQCVPINPGTTSHPTSILNYMYYGWASGYSAANAKINTVCGTGFLDSGGQPLSLCGWVTTPECLRSFYYDYCGGSEDCGTCFGSCGTDTLNCNANADFNRTISKIGTPFVCAAGKGPVQTINWKVFIIIAIVIFTLFIAIIVFVVFSLRSRGPTSRDIIVNS
jgi:hypothetical protein